MKYYELQDLYLENINKNDLEEILLSNQDVKEYYFILHDKDIKEKTNELKKPHYHCCIGYEDYGRYTIDKVREYFKPLNTHIKAITSFKKFIRYLIHLDDKSKYQYDLNDVITNNQDKYEKQLINKDVSIDSCVNGFIDEVMRMNINCDYDIICYFQAQNKTSYLICHYKSILDMFLDLRRIRSDYSKDRKEFDKRC